MRRLLTIAIVLLAYPLIAAGSCATTSEPRIEVREVKVVVPVPCDPDPKPVKPNLPDTDAAIAAAPDIFVLSTLYKAGKKLRDGYIGELEAALGGCMGD